MGLTANDPNYQPGFEDVDTSVRAMIPIYGVFDWTGSSRSDYDDVLREILGIDEEEIVEYIAAGALD